MPIFMSDQDYAFITGVNTELLDQVIKTSVILYSIDESNSNANVYGESTEKIYKPGIICNALITHDDQRTDDDQFGPNVFQNIICGFQRTTMKEKDFYPERGDVIKYSDSYYECTGVVDNQFISGRVGMPHSILCTAVMTNKSTVNVRYETPDQ